MYMRNTIFLNSELPSRLRPVLSVKLRQVRGIVSAVVEEKKVTVYYMGRLDLRALQLFVRAFEENMAARKKPRTTIWTSPRTAGKRSYPSAASSP